MHACLDVTCHLHSRQNDQGLLRAAVVTQGWNRHQKRAQRVNSGEEHSPATSARTGTRNLSITSLALLPSYPSCLGMSKEGRKHHVNEVLKPATSGHYFIRRVQCYLFCTFWLLFSLQSQREIFLQGIQVSIPKKKKIVVMVALRS